MGTMIDLRELGPMIIFFPLSQCLPSSILVVCRPQASTITWPTSLQNSKGIGSIYLSKIDEQIWHCWIYLKVWKRRGAGEWEDKVINNPHTSLAFLPHATRRVWIGMSLVQGWNNFSSNVNVILRSLTDENYCFAKHRFLVVWQADSCSGQYRTRWKLLRMDELVFMGFPRWQGIRMREGIGNHIQWFPRWQGIRTRSEILVVSFHWHL